MFSRFDTIPACDGHTDTDRQIPVQTHGDGIYRANIASRGKNQMDRLQRIFDEYAMGGSSFFSCS